MESNFLIIVLRVIDGANGIYFDRITKEPHAFSEKQPESYKDNHFVLIPIKVKACVAWVTVILLSAGYLCYRNKKKR